MFRSILRKIYWILLPVIFLQGSPVTGQEQDWYFDQEGFKPNQNNQFGIGEESINLFNGNLILSYIDIQLPGYCGNDLRVQRVYNSKIKKWEGINPLNIEPSWVGLGWTLHMGRLYNFDSSLPNDPNPVVEMPDGSRHMFYPDTEAHPDARCDFRSKDNWGYYNASGNSGWVFLNDGTHLRFMREEGAGQATDEEGVSFMPLQSIFNSNWCNPIWIYYDEAHQGGRNISRIQIGGEINDPIGTHPEIFFITEPPNYDRLIRIEYTDSNGVTRSINYDVQDSGTTKLLLSVTPAVGPAVQYFYAAAPDYELTDVYTPFSGIVPTFPPDPPTPGNMHYTYATQSIPLSDDYHTCDPSIPCRTVTSKTYTGSDTVSGTWTYDYPTAVADHYTVVTDPLGNVSRHYYFGFGGHTGELGRWQVGLNYKNEFYEGAASPSTLLKVEDIVWGSHPFGTDEGFSSHRDPPISGCPMIGDCTLADCLAKQPRMSEKTVTYNPASANSVYHTTYYDAYDLYGNLTQMRETQFNNADPTKNRKTVTQYVWEQANDTDHDFIYIHVVSHILNTKKYVGESSPQLIYEVENLYDEYLGSYEWRCKFGKLIQTRIDPLNLNITTNYSYVDDPLNNQDGYLYQITDPRGKIWTYSWQNHALKSIATPVGWSKFDRTINFNTGLVETQDDPNGKQTSFTYDALGRLTQISYPIENSVSVSYNEVSSEFDNVTTARDNSEVVEYYDDLGRVKTVRKNVEGSGNYSYIHYEYDALGRKTFESEPTFSSSCSSCPGTTYQYDALDRVTQLTTPDGTYTYLYDGDTTTITNPKGKTKIIVKDPFGNIVQLTDEDTNVYLFEYDVLDNLKTINGPGTNDRTFVYDGAGRLTSENHPESGQTVYILDPNGNITKKTFNDTTYLQQTFDDNNRLTQKYFSKDDITIDFAYDGSSTSNLNGQLASQTFPEGSIEYQTYDALGKPLTVRYNYPPSVDYTVSYHYDSNGNNDQITYPSGYVLDLVYGHDNRVKTVTDFTTVGGIVYNAAGGISGIDFSNGVQTVIPTDPSLRNRPNYIETTKSGPLLKLDYDYDSMGNVSGIKRYPNSSWDTYTYDDLNRFSRVDYGTLGEYLEYTYDLDGNVTDLSSNITGHSGWSLAYQDNKISTSGYTYDSNGNITLYPASGGGNKNLTYGYENKIVTASINSRSPVTFTYDGHGRRIIKSSAGNETYFIHDRNGNILAEINDSGDVVIEYIYAGKYLIGKLDTSQQAVPAMSIRGLAVLTLFFVFLLWKDRRKCLSTVCILICLSFMLFQVNTLYSARNGVEYSDRNLRSDDTYFYHLDHLGSIRLITDDSGNVVWPGDYSSEGMARYLPFGELYKPSEREYDNASCSTKLKFVSKEHDDETQLSYFGARYLEHARAPRFTSPDPTLMANFDLMNPQSFNLYTYSYNNPMSLMDPTGESPLYFTFDFAGFKLAADPVYIAIVPSAYMAACDYLAYKKYGIHGLGTDEDALAPMRVGATQTIGILIFVVQDKTVRAKLIAAYLDFMADESGGKKSKKAFDSKKSERHGDAGRALDKAEKQIQELKEKLKSTKEKKEKKKLEQKIENIRKAAERKKKGETHWN